MEGRPTCFCAVLDCSSHGGLICYSRRSSGAFSLSLTDATDVWSSEFSEDALLEFRQRFQLRSSDDDFILRLRSSCGDVSVAIRDGAAELRVGSGPGAPCVALSRLEAPEATGQLKELLFSMASSLTQLQGAPPVVSPVKSHQRRPVDCEPRQQNGAATKRRAAGASLINPGAKKKLQATGVSFDDAD